MHMGMELAETLQNPDIVSRSSKDPDAVRIYIKWFENTRIGNKWLRVVVKFEDLTDAFVMTAYARSRMDTGEIIWQEQNP